MVRRAAMTNEPIERDLEFKGLRTQDEPEEVGFDGMVVSNNVDYRRKGKISRRPGQMDTGYTPGGTIISAWADSRLFLFQEDDQLMSFDGANATVLRSGLTVGGNISAQRVANNTYWSNGFETGVVVSGAGNRDLGVPVPARFVGTEVSGNLGAGRYSYCFTDVESDGRESGSPLPITTSVEENSGLSFTLPPGLVRRFWITETNGDTLYLGAEIPVGETSFVYRNRYPITSITLDRMIMSPPLPWTEIDWFNASLLFAVGDRVEWSNVFDYELVDRARNYIPLGEKVCIIAGVDDGFYIGTETSHYWLSGDSQETLNISSRADYGAIPGTKAYVNGLVVGSGEATEMLPIWATQRGFVVGLPGGTLRNVHERLVDFPSNQLYGTALYRNADRQNHYIALVRG